MGHCQTWYVSSTSCWVTLAVARSRHFCDGYGRKWMGPDYFKDTFRYLFISELRLETWRLYLAGSIIWSSYISCSAARPSGTFCEIKQPQLPGAWSAESKCFREGAQIFQIKKKCRPFSSGWNALSMFGWGAWSTEQWNERQLLQRQYSPQIYHPASSFLAWSVSSSIAYKMYLFITYKNDSDMKNKTKQM